MSQDNEHWNWNSDTQGRVTSVSSGFTSIFGTSAGKDIIGNYFWTFAEGTDKPTSGWIELDNAFKQQIKINKFIFHYHRQKDKVKIAISGEPIFEKNKYLGFSGTGYIAENSELSIPEISQNIMRISLDNLDLGIAMFSPNRELIEYNQNFVTHMNDAKIKIDRQMTYDNILDFLKKRNIYQPHLSSDDNNTSINAHYYFEKANQSFLYVKRKILDNGLIIVKTEIDNHLKQSLKNHKDILKELKQQNQMLELRIQDYKDKLSDFFNKKNDLEKKNSEKQDNEYKKTLNFYENNIDIGILVTNINGDIENVNYCMAQIFGFTTASMLVFHAKDGDFKNYLIQRQKHIDALRDNNINRFEHILSINNFLSQGDFKEVIVFYPSLHNPQKIISLFYPLVSVKNEQSDSIFKNNLNHQFDIYQEFIHYMVDDIKSSLHVIDGYNDLQLINHEPNQLIPYNKHIHESCNHILRSISDIMQIYKISINLNCLEQSAFSCREILNACLENIHQFIIDNQITINMDEKENDLLIISDKKIFYDGITKIINSVVKSSKQGSQLKIKIIGDVELAKISLIIIDESQFNIQNLIKTNISDIFTNSKIRNTGSLDFKIGENYLKLLKCKVTAINKNEQGNKLTIEMSGDMITSHKQRDKDNLVI